MRVSWVPCSAMMLPSPSLLTTQMMSQSLMVESLCAMMTVVLIPFSLRSSSMLSWTILSLSLSSAAVASSRRRISGFEMRALAMAILCLCPPLSFPPAMPTLVSYPLLSCPTMKLWAFEVLAACSTSSFVAPSFPIAMFSKMVVLKRMGCCPTRPMFFLRYLMSCSFIALFETVTVPLAFSSPSSTSSIVNPPFSLSTSL
mmetsp:Transcript_22245/g.46204  ORF Transcript_22245/g.46204 Transcript_22245/m.46204 type:complete len:200 (+) Transcript_22245:103-702(+)